MGTPWDRAAAGYLEEWVPRFVPYHTDLVREMALREGQRVLVTSAGPGAEVIGVARVVGAEGFVRATDSSAEMVRHCTEQVERAGLPTRVECVQADASDASGGPWDAVVCAFGLWQLPARSETLNRWAQALAPRGKVGIVTWGPSDPVEPFERLALCLAEVEPGYAVPTTHVQAERDAMSSMFTQAGLGMVAKRARGDASGRSSEKRGSSAWRRAFTSRSGVPEHRCRFTLRRRSLSRRCPGRTWNWS
jgi:SAM-dependent methyltransferase